MKGIFKAFLIGILGFLGLTIGVKADNPPENFYVWNVEPTKEYIQGIAGYYKPVNDTVVFCLEEGLTYVPNTQYKVKEKVDEGFIYILEHKPGTGDKYKDYYIQSIAVWWYEDYLLGTDKNLSKEKKDYIKEHRTDDEVCKLVYDLVQGAIAYKQVKGSFSFTTSNITWTLEDGYYISSKITVKGTAITSVKELKLTSAPTGTTIINKSINDKGNGTFQVKVPKSAVTSASVDIKFNISGTYKIKKVYDYEIAYKPQPGVQYQLVLYGEVYSDPYDVDATETIKLAKPENKLTVNKVDENNKAVTGATLVLYKGDCTNSECKDEYATWTTTSSAKEFKNIPVGKYTLAETKAPAGYKVAKKILVNIDADDKTYTIKMIDEKLKVRISKTDVTGDKELPGATLELKDANKKVVEKWVSTDKPHYIELEAGEYSLTETIAPKGYVLSKTTITFKVDSNNNIYEKDAVGKWVKVDYIKMINEKELQVRISKTDVTGDKEVPGATLELKDANKKVVEKWVSTDKPHYVVLEAGEYYLTETIAPEGYALSETTINFKVDKNNNIYEKDAAGKWVKVDYIKMINERVFDIRISKTDITGDKEIPGATLVLNNESGQEIAKWVSTTEPHYETLRAGIYTLTETIAPKGYILSKTSITFKVDNDGNVYEKNANGDFVKVPFIKMVNVVKSAINISKLDADTNEYVSGAELAIKNLKGEIIASWTTTNESHYLDLDEGEYILVETKAPENYILDTTPIYIKVDADGNLFVKDNTGTYIAANGVIMYNKPEEIIIPATGLSSSITYIIGTLVLGFGAIMYYRNEKEC